MAQFTRQNGDYYPVMNYDQPDYTNPGVNAVESGFTVQPQGPKLQYFTVAITGANPASGAQINAVVHTIQQLATDYIYEYTTATNSTLAVGMYPVDAWGDVTATGAGSLDLAITEALTALAGSTVNCVITNSATFTN